MLENRSTILKKKRRIKGFIQNYMQRKRALNYMQQHVTYVTQQDMQDMQDMQNMQDY